MMEKCLKRKLDGKIAQITIIGYYYL